MNKLLLQHLHKCHAFSSWVFRVSTSFFKTLFSSKTFTWVFCELIILPWVCCCYCQSCNGFQKRQNLDQSFFSFGGVFATADSKTGCFDPKHGDLFSTAFFANIYSLLSLLPEFSASILLWVCCCFCQSCNLLLNLLGFESTKTLDQSLFSFGDVFATAGSQVALTQKMVICFE